MNNEYKTGHPVLGVILGILGILAAVTLTFFTGVIGCGIAVLLGLIALILGIKARRAGRGVGAIIAGLLALLVAAGAMTATLGIFRTMRDKAAEAKTAPLVEEYAAKPYLGLLGILINLPEDEAGATEFLEQLKSLS